MKKLVYAATLLVSLMSCTGKTNNKTEDMEASETKVKMDTATFGAGCFWCVEAVFQRLEGVVKITSGYSGGSVKNPAYREVCTGTTGHA